MVAPSLLDSAAGLKGQRALVTGGNGGIAAAISQSLAAAGVHVVINYAANAESAEQLVADITDAVVWMVSDAADYVTGMTLYPEFSGGG